MILYSQPKLFLSFYSRVRDGITAVETSDETSTPPIPEALPLANTKRCFAIFLTERAEAEGRDNPTDEEIDDVWDRDDVPFFNFINPYFVFLKELRTNPSGTSRNIGLRHFNLISGETICGIQSGKSAIT